MKRWAVVLLGIGLFAAATLQIYSDDDLVFVDAIEVGMPLVVGLGLVVGGVWLRRTTQPRRTARIAIWTIAGALLGHAVNLWFLFIISLEQVPTGEPVVLNLNGAAIFMAISSVLGYYATGLRQRQQDLERSEARFRALTEHSPFAVVTIDETSTIRYANDAVADLFGYAPSDLVGEPLTMLMPERFRDDHRNGLNDYLSSGDRMLDWDGIELAAEHADGDEFPVEVSFGEYTTDDTQLFTGVIQDISDRKTAEARLRDHTTKVTRLHELATDITAAETTDAIYQRTADGAVDLFDGDVARVAVRENDQLVPAASSGDESLEDCDPLSIPMGYAGQSYESGVVSRVADLTNTRSTTTAATPGSDDTPQPQEDGGSHTGEEPKYRSLLTVPFEEIGVLQVFATEADAFSDRDEDVAEMLATHVKAAHDQVVVETTLRRERDRLDEFASVLSHDIRNPLNVALGRLDLIRGDSDAENEEHLAAVERSLDRIQRLIEDVLTLAREGKAVGETETVKLEQVAQQAWGNVATENATLETESLGMIEADRSRLVQVFENLYRNAIEHGGNDVTITIGYLDDGFFVEDTGPGIPPEERDHVYEHGHSTSTDGTGYGLTIVKRIVEAHDWAITVTEGTEGGARFEISGCDISD